MTDDFELTISISLKRKRPPETNAGPRFHDSTITWEDEAFSRWMGWRGKEAQEEEIRNKRKGGSE